MTIGSPAPDISHQAEQMKSPTIVKPLEHPWLRSRRTSILLATSLWQDYAGQPHIGVTSRSVGWNKGWPLTTR